MWKSWITFWLVLRTSTRCKWSVWERTLFISAQQEWPGTKWILVAQHFLPGFISILGMIGSCHLWTLGSKNVMSESWYAYLMMPSWPRLCCDSKHKVPCSSLCKYLENIMVTGPNMPGQSLIRPLSWVPELCFNEEQNPSGGALALPPPSWSPLVPHSIDKPIHTLRDHFRTYIIAPSSLCQSVYLRQDSMSRIGKRRHWQPFSLKKDRW